MSDFKAKNAPNSTLAGAPPQTPLGGPYSTPPDPLAGLKGAYGLVFSTKILGRRSPSPVWGSGGIAPRKF